MTEKEKVCVLLDLDNTILDFSAAEKAALSRALREFGVEPRAETLARYSELNGICWERMEDGELSRDEVLVLRFELLFEELGLACSGAEVNRRYETLLHEGHWFMPRAEALLEALHGRYRLFIVSNGVASVQDSRIASAGIARYFENIFISERVGFHKPQREFFEACFARIPGFAPERALVIGDSLSSDIRGGLNAGLRTCWYNLGRKPGRTDIVPDYEISALDELPPLLERVFA